MIQLLIMSINPQKSWDNGATYFVRKHRLEGQSSQAAPPQDTPARKRDNLKLEMSKFHTSKTFKE